MNSSAFRFVGAFSEAEKADVAQRLQLPTDIGAAVVDDNILQAESVELLAYALNSAAAVIHVVLHQFKADCASPRIILSYRSSGLRGASCSLLSELGVHLVSVHVDFLNSAAAKSLQLVVAHTGQGEILPPNEYGEAHEEQSYKLAATLTESVILFLFLHEFAHAAAGHLGVWSAYVATRLGDGEDYKNISGQQLDSSSAGDTRKALEIHADRLAGKLLSKFLDGRIANVLPTMPIHHFHWLVAAVIGSVLADFETANTPHYYPPNVRALLLCNELESYTEQEISIDDDSRAIFFVKTATSNFFGLGAYLGEEFDPQSHQNSRAAIVLADFLEHEVVVDLFPDVVEVWACQELWVSSLSDDWRMALLSRYLFPARLVRQFSTQSLRAAVEAGGTQVPTEIPKDLVARALTLALSPRLVVWTGRRKSGLHGYDPSGERSDWLS